MTPDGATTTGTITIRGRVNHHCELSSGRKKTLHRRLLSTHTCRAAILANCPAEQDSRSPPRRGRYYDQHQADSDQYASLYDDDVGDRPTTRRRVSVSPARSRGSGDEHDGRGYHRGRGGRGGRDGYGQSRRPNVESQTLILGNLPHDVEEQDVRVNVLVLLAQAESGVLIRVIRF